MISVNLKKQRKTKVESTRKARRLQKVRSATAICSRFYIKPTVLLSRDDRPEAPFLRAAWRRSAGLPEVAELGAAPSLVALAASEWSDGFERAMRVRLIMGALRHGAIGATGKRRYDRVGSMARRLADYRLDGNLEHLVDVANLALIEFVESDHPRRHWAAMDDGPHTRECAK